MKASDQSLNQSVEILIAEDSPTQAERLKHTLEGRGYHVTVTSNGRQALEAAKIRKPTLIISDIVMPEMDGYELCKKVKSDSDLRNLPVILLTTLSDPQDVIRGLECLADNFIIKPYDEDYLLSHVEYVIINQQIRVHENAAMGVEIYFSGNKHFITADRLQILNLLLSTYEAAIQKNRQLTRAQDDLRRANAAMEAANKELEAFNYSVSHDLHAPLRRIDGFSQMLLEDYSDKLDEDGTRALKVVRKNAQNMGHLIDDLLALSRLGRTAIELSPIDMTDMAKSVFEELNASDSAQGTQFKVENIPPAQGDRALIRQVFVNLLSNATKYSRLKDQPVIEVGGRTENGNNLYFVKDNGAGFDMQYANKLFGVFQRLHSAQEFEGTGVGLAIVQRIIHRHGGRVWADGKVNEGATFYFTLPKECETGGKRSQHE
jgi:two-component system sensor histidine kinase/response regulator